jgi:ubiquinone/menaquinone biosynthesis C-methylase UbiE
MISFYTRVALEVWKFASMNLLRFGQDEAGYLKKLYMQLLNREVDPSGYKHYLEKRKSSSHYRWRVRTLLEIIRSPEFKARISKASVTGKDFNTCHHEARMIWIKTRIPSAQDILDLGGSCTYDKDGALIAMGYPHKCRKITIIDFPPDERVASSHSTLAEDKHIAKNGAQVEFVYDSFVNLAPYKDQSYDMIFAGQVIEHVTIEEAEHIFRECHRILKPGGKICLDTPNRIITRFITSDFIHPEHKIEYEPAHLERIANSAGFRTIEKGSISPMPLSYAKKKFIPLEINNIAIRDANPENGFSFYLTLEKVQV